MIRTSKYMVRYVANSVSYISAKFGEIIFRFRPFFVDETKFGYIWHFWNFFQKKKRRKNMELIFI